MKYIKKFKNHEEYENYIFSSDAALPNVSACVNEDEVHYTKEPHNYRNDCLTLKVISGGTLTWKANDYSAKKTIQVHTGDEIGWIGLTSSVEGLEEEVKINVSKGDTVKIRGNENTYSTDGFYSSFGGSAVFDVEGNIMSLLSTEDFEQMDTLTEPATFYRLFSECNVVNTENLILPATTLAKSCYSAMFRDCISLTTAPQLPATTLAQSCYSSMFGNCTSLTTAPELPATTLSPSCYESMFVHCTSLTTAPKLPAAVLATGCYSGMFDNCTDLITPPILSARTLSESCYYHMFEGCTNLTRVPELPANALATACYSGMFIGCTNITESPFLEATTLVNGCYDSMFANCSNLSTVHCYATSISARYATNNWLDGVKSSGVFEKDPSITWPSGPSGVPQGWYVIDHDSPL